MKSALAFVHAIVLVSLAFAGCAEGRDDESVETESDLKVCGFQRTALEDRTAALTPKLSTLDVVADLPFPPGNVAAAVDGRIFLSFFPDSNKGDSQVALLEGGAPRPFPDLAFQSSLRTVLGIRADRHQRLWILDHGQHGLHKAQLVAIDLATNGEAFRLVFDRDIAPIGSMLNDLEISPDGKTVYISDTAEIRGHHAIVVVDVDARTARRRLVDHPSVGSGAFDVIVDDRRLKIAGVLCPKFGVDGIALDHEGEQLYYAALNGGEVFRVSTALLRDPTVDEGTLGAAVEKYADATMTDGMITDGAGNVYLTDMEHSAIMRIRPDRSLEVVVRDPRLRWPDGFAWAPNGDLLVTASALHLNLPDLVKTKASVGAHAPYQVFRLRPDN